MKPIKEIELELIAINDKYQKKLITTLKTIENNFYEECVQLENHQRSLHNELSNIILNCTEDKKEKERLKEKFIRSGVLELEKIFIEFKHN